MGAREGHTHEDGQDAHARRRAYADRPQGARLRETATRGAARVNQTQTGFAPSQRGAWDIAVAGGLVVIPGAELLLALG
jgi:hypothetical protein